MHPECNNRITKEELSLILGTFLGRLPHVVQIRDIECEEFPGGFGVNSDLYKIRIEYATHHDIPVPSEVLLKQHKKELFGITQKGKSTQRVYLRELKFGEFANLRLFVLENGVRLFPTFYNAGLTSEANSEDVTRTLEMLQRKKILLMEYIPGQSLDKKIYQLRRNQENLQRRINLLEKNKRYLEDIQSLKREAEGLDKKILDIVKNGIETTRYFHDELRGISPESGLLPQNKISINGFITKFIRYNEILLHERLNKSTRGELWDIYTPIIKFISGKDDRTKDLVGIIHGDLHQGNIILDERVDHIRFVDAGNIVTDGASVAFDIAPQVFNPPVVSYPPEEIVSLLDSTYLKDNLLEHREDLYLATILAGHKWCFQAAAANVVSRKKNLAQYELFLSHHTNHENAISLYLTFSHRLLSYLIKNQSSFKMSEKLSESVRRLREFEYTRHKELIENSSS